MTPSADTAPGSSANPCLRVRIGDVDVAVQSDIAGLLDEVAELYPSTSEAAVASQTIQMEVRQTCSRLGGRRYGVYGDGMEIGAELRRKEVIPFLEWGINLRIIATQSRYVQLHAASMARAGEGYIFAGSSGSGKSTLAAGLMARDWDYLCDEFALIDRNSLRLVPLRKPLCIKAGSFAVMRQLGQPFARRRDYIKALKGKVGYINPDDTSKRIPVNTVPIRYVIFPKYADKQKPRLHSITRARALMDLAGCVFNRHVFDDQGLSVLTRALHGVKCYRLEAGDIRDTCDLIEGQLGQPSTPVENVSMPHRVGSSRSEAVPSRREALRRGAKLAYLVPTVMTLTAQQAFASGNPSGMCSTAVQTGGLCESDPDCCGRDCDFGICQ